jgi:hypothetical protein
MVSDNAACSARRAYSLKHHRTIHTRKAYTFVEVMISVVILMFFSAGVSMMVSAGMMTLVTQWEIVSVNNARASKMEALLASEYDQLASGSEALEINGLSYTLNWTIENIDLDGNGVDESDAKKIIVELGGRPLECIRVDTGEGMAPLSGV